MVICCLGDSLTEGDYGIYGKRCIANVKSENYPHFLSLLSGAEVRNYGKCGFDASAYLDYYNSGAVNVTEAGIIIIMLGTNGGMEPDCDTKGNRDYTELVKRCINDAPGARVMLCTPPHATENPRMSNYGYAERVKKAAAFVRKTAAELDVDIIDLAESGLFTAENESVMQPNDGLHFSAVGYRTMAGYIYNFLKLKKYL